MPTYKEIITDAKDRMSKTREAFKREMQSMRAGRANPQILDQASPWTITACRPTLNQMGNISCARAAYAGDRARGSAKMISADGKGHPEVRPGHQSLQRRPGDPPRLCPELNEERRKELCKQVRKQLPRTARSPCRNIRRDAMEQIKKMKKDSVITEDDLSARPRTEMQKVTDAAHQGCSTRSPPIRKRRL